MQKATAFAGMGRPPYFTYEYTVSTSSKTCSSDGSEEAQSHDADHVRALRIGTDGSAQEIVVGDGYLDTSSACGPTSEAPPGSEGGECPNDLGSTRSNVWTGNGANGGFITNADQGVVYASRACSNPDDQNTCGSRLTTITEGGAATTATVAAHDAYPVLQAEDGSYFGTMTVNDLGYLSSFDASGTVRWRVAGDFQPLIATADGGLIAKQATAGGVFRVTFDAGGNVVGQVADSGQQQSWSGNTYRVGSVDSVAVVPMMMAQSLWAQVGSNPSGSGTAARPWYFVLVWQNDFTFTPDKPLELPNLTTDISYRAGVIKEAALRALRDAYSGVPVTMLEGTSGTGDVSVTVLDHQTVDPRPSYGVTDSNNVSVHQVDYINNMEDAQWAYSVVINNAQDESLALQQRIDLIQAIGRAIGNNAAHEIAHQFLVACCQMDADPTSDTNARGTFNAKGANPATDPSFWTGYWPSPKINLHWEDAQGQSGTALKALGQCLGKGWHNFHGLSCHD